MLMGIWQIADGVYTIVYYGFFKTSMILKEINADSSTSLINSEFIFICSFGTLLVILGLVNILMSKKYIHDETTSKKVGFYLCAQSLFSYFILDIISLILGMSAGVIYLAKNKSIKLKKVQGS
ncbi:hypothetical protein FA707_08475 [Vagococcus zengguangii]|uniref:Uncharacterized protein n=3 Tax=Vagococcus zengguangii TaxID=2571750 RepID=A0A4D7CS72_9ENTE|nr:hypothetical protein FA707_08475 [Vagococcus zengguangii]